MTRLEMNREFADNLERERISLNLTQKQMASKLEMSLSAYKRLITCSTDKIDLYVKNSKHLYLYSIFLSFQID